MSWQDYVDHQLINQGLAHAAFIGDDLALSEAERRAMFRAFENPDHVLETGLDLAERHFLSVAADDRIIKGRNGAMLVKMKSFIIVGEYAALPPAQAQHFINKVADQLTAVGY
ncbi:profilin [Aspergillus sergii]|uniref:Profilin n=1 Tax=Aspergillus sergii TaxID=1034303 RepID=A0A5N6XGD4_9EURO|nr:profilin [Aspergillus sergii]